MFRFTTEIDDTFYCSAKISRLDYIAGHLYGSTGGRYMLRYTGCNALQHSVCYANGDSLACHTDVCTVFYSLMSSARRRSSRNQCERAMTLSLKSNTGLTLPLDAAEICFKIFAEVQKQRAQPPFLNGG